MLQHPAAAGGPDSALPLPTQTHELFDLSNGFQAIAIGERMPFAEARNMCTSLGGHLASVHNLAENQMLWATVMALKAKIGALGKAGDEGEYYCETIRMWHQPLARYTSAPSLVMHVHMTQAWEGVPLT